MATVTLKITLRRTEGRNRVDDLDIAAAVAQAVEDLDEISVDDLEGDEASYEVSRVALVIAQPALPEAEPVDSSSCLLCGAPLLNLIGGRRRQYCSDACKQAAFRDRKHAATLQMRQMILDSRK
jgi:hypothetical protein